MDALLYRLAAGALEPGDALALGRRIDASPALARRWAWISAAVGPGPRPVAPLEAFVRSPPARFEVRCIDLDAAPAPGSRLVLDVGAPDDPDRWRPVIWGDGEVVHPLSPEAFVTLASFREGREIDLVTVWSRLRLVLVPLEHAVDWGDPARWDAVLAAALRGEWPGWEW